MQKRPKAAALAAALSLGAVLTGCSAAPPEGVPPVRAPAAHTFAAADTAAWMPGEYIPETMSFAGPIRSIAADGVVTIEAQQLGEVACLTGPGTVMVNAVTGRRMEPSDLRLGDYASVSVSRALTRSEPLGAVCFALISGGPEGGLGNAVYLEAREVRRNPDGTLEVLSEDRDLAVTIPAQVPVEILGADETVPPVVVGPGSRLIVWLDDISLSRPGRAVAQLAVLCPAAPR